MASDNSKLTREGLYELVWSKPATELAKELGVSDVMIGKWCRQMEVPRPPPGYWARLRAGQVPAKPPLPRVIDSIAKPHPLVTTAKIILRNGDVDTRQILVGVSGTYLDIRVSRAALDRALCLADHLIKSVERLGHEVRVVQSSHKSVFVIFGKQIPFHIAERVVEVDVQPRRKKHRDDGFDRSWPYPRMETRPTGQLSLTCGDEAWSDAPTRRLEEYLGSVVRKIERIADEEKAQAEQRRRDRVEREARERRDKGEAENLQRLERHLAAWEYARSIRNYISYFKKHIPGLPEEQRGPATEFADWALARAEHFDPLRGAWDRLPAHPREAEQKQAASDRVDLENRLWDIKAAASKWRPWPRK